MNKLSCSAPLRIVAVSGAIVVASCSSVARAVPQLLGLPATDQLSNASVRGADRLAFGVDLTARSRDGRYRLRSLHLTGVKVHQSIAFATNAGTVTQVEYGTPYGPLTVVQYARAAARKTLAGGEVASAGFNSKQLPPGVEVVIANGTTPHGAKWTVANTPTGPGYDVHIEFPDSSLDTQLPAGVSMARIGDVAAELY